MTTTSTRKLSAAQAIAWATAEVAVTQGKAAVELLKIRRDEMRARHEDRLRPSTNRADEGKDVKVGSAGGWSIRFTRFTDGDHFSLKSYREAGHEITDTMRPHISPGAPRVRVTVKRVKGPAKPGAVEPA